MCSKPSTRKTKLRRITYEKNKCVTIDPGRNDCGYLCGTDLFYQCLWTRKRCDPGKDLRGSDYLTDLYAGSDSGTFCWMFAQQHLDRMHGTRRDIWQSGNPDRCDWHLSFKKDQVCLYLAAGDR